MEHWTRLSKWYTYSNVNKTKEVLTIQLQNKIPALSDCHYEVFSRASQ